MPESFQEYSTEVCIAGGGPAGMILGLLLAKAGRKVLVLEQHHDFQREYRGEVFMPRFLQMMRALGLEKEILSVPHLLMERAEMFYQNQRLGAFEFNAIAPEAPLALWMPQTLLLEKLHRLASAFPDFKLWFDARAASICREGNKVSGVIVDHAKVKKTVKAHVTVGADGRFSTIRRAGKFEREFHEHPFDIIWFTLPQPEGYDNVLRFFLNPPHNLLTLPKYPKHIQCGLVVEKDGYQKIKQRGIDAMREILLQTHPMVFEFARDLQDFKPFNVLQAELEMIREWSQDGLLLIGDAAHTCSPVGAIGVSVAVETAIAAAGVLLKCLEKNNFSKEALGEIQSLRKKDIHGIHGLQRRFSSMLLARNPIVRFLLPMLLSRLFRCPILHRLQRRMILLNQPLIPDPRFVFK